MEPLMTAQPDGLVHLCATDRCLQRRNHSFLKMDHTRAIALATREV